MSAYQHRVAVFIDGEHICEGFVVSDDGLSWQIFYTSQDTGNCTYIYANGRKYAESNGGLWESNIPDRINLVAVRIDN